MLDLLDFAQRETAPDKSSASPKRKRGALTELDSGEMVNPTALVKDPRNVHNLPEGTIRSRLFDQEIRDIEGLLGPKRTIGPLRGSRIHTLTDGTTGTTVQLHRDPRNVHNVTRTTIENRLNSQRQLDPAIVYRAPSNRYAAKKTP